jgi:hypothetical protein
MRDSETEQVKMPQILSHVGSLGTKAMWEEECVTVLRSCAFNMKLLANS